MHCSEEILTFAGQCLAICVQLTPVGMLGLDLDAQPEQSIMSFDLTA